MTKIYNKLFKDPYYGTIEPYKIALVSTWAQQNNLKKLIDIGCGRGHYIRALDEQGFQVTGIEPSEYLIKHDLKELLPIHSDIMGLKTKRKWDGLFCMDVLEHLSYDELGDNLKVLAKLAPKALYGIANHPDNFMGYELHNIQQEVDWWLARLGEHYKKVELTYEPARYFMIECEN